MRFNRSVIQTLPLTTLLIHSSTSRLILELPELSATEVAEGYLKGRSSFAIGSEGVGRRWGERDGHATPNAQFSVTDQVEKSNAWSEDGTSFLVQSEVGHAPVFDLDELA